MTKLGAEYLSATHPNTQHENIPIVDSPGWYMADDPNRQIAIVGPANLLAEFQWQTDEAVDSGYIQECQAILAKLPNKSSDLTPQIFRLSEQEAEKLEENLLLYTKPYLAKYRKDLPDIPSPNPFNLLMPEGLKNIDAWVRENGSNLHYQDISSRRDQKRRGQYSYDHDSGETEDNYIRLIKAWNEYHVGFLTTLNVADDRERKKQVDELGEKTFRKSPLGFHLQKPLTELSKYDNPRQWMVFHALNILHSSRVEVSPIARYRAMNVLSLYPMAELEKAFFGEKSADVSGRGRPVPSWEYTQGFKESLLRLPRSFWRDVRERTQPIHQNWEQNPVVQGIFNVTEGKDRGRVYDYGRIFNTLVTQYPKEAIHIALLMLTSIKHHDRPAFEALVNFSKLDPVSVQKIFGRGASYLLIHRMPTDTADQIAFGLGIDAFDEEIQYEGLNAEQLRQVLQRRDVTIEDLEERLVRAGHRMAEQRFAGMSSEDRARIDPLGYWRLLGVDPAMDPEDIDNQIKSAYRTLAKKYYEKGTEPNEEKMKQINLAYEVLGDVEKRKRYGA